jgi:hypothetical protein
VSTFSTMTMTTMTTMTTLPYEHVIVDPGQA